MLLGLEKGWLVSAEMTWSGLESCWDETVCMHVCVCVCDLIA